MTSRQIEVPEGAPFAKVTRTINYHPIAETFDYTIDVALARIFPRQGEAPGIASTTVPEGWNRAGQERINTSDDGSTTHERLLEVERPTRFSYRIDRFTAPLLEGLLDRIEGSWLFSNNGTTSIEWIYALVPKDAHARERVESYLLGRYRHTGRRPR